MLQMVNLDGLTFKGEMDIQENDLNGGLMSYILYSAIKIMNTATCTMNPYWLELIV